MLLTLTISKLIMFYLVVPNALKHIKAIIVILSSNDLMGQTCILGTTVGTNKSRTVRILTFIDGRGWYQYFSLSIYLPILALSSSTSCAVIITAKRTLNINFVLES